MHQHIAGLLAGIALAAASGSAHALIELTGVTAISTGNVHACAVTQAGAAYCWGANVSGRLGDNSTVSRAVALPVTGLSSGVVAISAGGSHTCALTSASGVKCWGANESGQLGNGTTTPSSVPVDVVGLSSGVAKISAGGTHTCAVTNAGAVKCWGSNSEGELGNAFTTAVPSPVDVIGLSSGIADVAAASLHTCALTTGGGVKCWGANESGQLGTGTMTRSLQPADVLGLGSGVASISVARGAAKNVGISSMSGGNSCAVLTNGAAKCWGADASAQLGIGTTTGEPVTVPVDVTNLGPGTTATIAVGMFSACRVGLGGSSGYSHTCSVSPSGGLKCWGGNNYEALGFPLSTICPASDSDYRKVPTDVPAFPANQVAVAAGLAYTCSLGNDTKVRCWGLNSAGQLGAGESMFQPNSSAFYYRYNPLPVMQPDPNGPDLAISQVRSPVPASAGKDMVFTYTVTNAGAAAASNVVLDNSPPSGTQVVWATPNCTRSSTSVRCSVDSLASGTAFQAKAVFRYPVAGSFTNTATVSGSIAESNNTNNASSTVTTVNATPAGVPVLRYRLYSDISKEHHYTTDLNEYTTLGTMGWQQEGTVGKVLDNPGAFNGVTAIPYYRLYDNQTLRHHWTSDANEYYTLAEFPWWSREGADGWILPTQAAGTIPLYRLLYPYVTALHHWTIDAAEYIALINQYGWIGEGAAGYVIP